PCCSVPTCGPPGCPDGPCLLPLLKAGLPAGFPGGPFFSPPSFLSPRSFERTLESRCCFLSLSLSGAALPGGSARTVAGVAIIADKREAAAKTACRDEIMNSSQMLTPTRSLPRIERGTSLLVAKEGSV